MGGEKEYRNRQGAKRLFRRVGFASNLSFSAKKLDKFRLVELFYLSRRLGMESRVSVFGIDVGARHHRLKRELISRFLF